MPTDVERFLEKNGQRPSHRPYRTQIATKLERTTVHQRRPTSTTSPTARISSSLRILIPTLQPLLLRVPVDVLGKDAENAVRNEH
eukprot:scaffold29920_cov65-Cyclotella_meneghiniana.AAC.2